MLRQMIPCISLFILMSAPGVALGKGDTVELSITGPALVAPVHTSDEVAIGVSVWGGQFADWDAGAVSEPPSALPRYLVHFWVQVPRGTVQMKYVVEYVWDSDAQRAYVHLPGPREIWHRTNVYSILRRGQDGHWFHATEPWGEAIRRVLSTQQVGQGQGATDL